ncbi:MAG: hypothetical protein WAP03_04620 [Methylorubrum rhodinum]|uniref:hypothetical protein n=1 Tax=Methylorubrum rhodinum TaxID=29428 RepID=UPI003BB01E66
MSRRTDRRTEIAAIRGLLAGAALDREAIRLERMLRRKYSDDQPRAPAGQSDGGQWVPAGGAGGGATGGRSGGSDGDVAGRERTLLDDGTQVLTIRVRAGRRDHDEQHVVTAPDGESRIFETSGLTQTIRDGATGAVLGRSTFTAAGAEPEAFVQSTFLPAIPLTTAVTVRLAGALFAVLSARNDRFGKAVLGLTANEYAIDLTETGVSAAFASRIDQRTLDAACRRNGEVEALAEQAVRSVRASGLYRSAQDFGNKVHAWIAAAVNKQEDPNFVAEISFNDASRAARYGERNSTRIDLFERTSPGTTCVYDFKTGSANIGDDRALRLAAAASRHFPDTVRVIVIQVKPRS